MNRELWDKWCERGILFLVLAILVFGPLATGAVRTVEFLIIQGLTLAVMLLWLARLWISPRPQLLWPPICWAVVAFAGYAIIRYLTADIEYVARMETVRVLVYAFLFLAIVNNLHRQESAQFITLTLVFLAMGIAFYALYQFLADSDKVWSFTKPYKHRGTGTFISPNNLGGFLELILPLGLAYTLVSRAKVLTKVFTGYCSLVMMAGIAVTLSRGSWLAAGISVLIFFAILAFHRTYRIPALVTLALIIGLSLFFIPKSFLFEQRAKQLFSQGKVDDDKRFDLWEPAYRLWQENPWWGIGPNHFDYRFGKYRPKSIQQSPDRVHNDYLNTLTDWGIVGALLIAAALLFLAAGILKTWKHVRGGESDLGGRQSNKFALVLGASVGLLAILMHSVVDFNMHIPANALLAITLMALLSGYLRFATERYWVTTRAWMKMTLTILLLAGCVGLGWQGIRRAREHVWLNRAEHAEDGSDELIAALRHASKIEPQNFQTTYAIGEALRKQSWQGRESDYQQLAAQAMDWFQRGMKLNPYDDRNFLGCGLCLDWIGDHEKAGPYFDHAVELDPNSYFTSAYKGWHYVQVEDYAAAKIWLERSNRLFWQNNPIALSYLRIAHQKLLEKAFDNGPSLPAR
ncbi:MAG: hypothetical protein QOD03_708 [Verrucomicrobiota bacterium]